MKYNYKIYGLSVCSPMPIIEAIEIEKQETYDVTIEMKNVDFLPNEVNGAIYFQPEKIRFFIKNVGWYTVTNGSGILIESMNSAILDNIKCYLLGSAFGFLMIQRKKLAVHGSCVACQGKGVILTGESGAGKSTIATSLCLQGNTFVSDDVSALERLNNKVLVQMAYPQRKLCKDAAVLLGYTMDQMIPLDGPRDKYAVRLTKTSEYIETVELYNIIELCVSNNTEKVTATELNGYEKLTVFIHNIFRYELLVDIGLPADFMKKCLDVVKEIPMYRITRPYGQNTEEEIVDCIYELISEG